MLGYPSQCTLHDNKITHIELSVESINMTIGQRIKQARRASVPTISQQQLADACGVSQSAVSLWESGGVETLVGENLMRAAQALSVTPEWLLEGSGPGPGEAQRAALQQRQDLEKEIVEIALSIQALPKKRREAIKQIIKLVSDEK